MVNMRFRVCRLIRHCRVHPCVRATTRRARWNCDLVSLAITLCGLGYTAHALRCWSSQWQGRPIYRICWFAVFTEQVVSSVNAPELYSKCNWFESRPVHRLSWGSSWFSAANFGKYQTSPLIIPRRCSFKPSPIQHSVIQGHTNPGHPVVRANKFYSAQDWTFSVWPIWRLKFWGCTWSFGQFVDPCSNNPPFRRCAVQII